MKELFGGGDPVKLERAAIIVNRGWIPAQLKDKTTRPTEVNSR
jgi:cytochrome oxidase assembly protein ShyY1